MKGRCPTCGRNYEIATIAELPSFPFCAPRCRLIDLARWADGTYVVPGGELPPDDPRQPDDEDEGD
jgi:endogenous inhibitor of DNA gyrase (YacG/DUF329 family)